MNAVIIGASHAAAQASISLRQGGWSGGIIIIGDERELPYHRPPLSKDFLSGTKLIDDILIRPEAAYEAANIEMRLGVRVTEIKVKERLVQTDDGQAIAYEKLILATGARVRRLSVAGEGLDNVFYLRDSADVLAIKEKTATSKRAVIIGGGYIGLETAASLRKLGLEVVVLEAMSRILQRVTAPQLSQFYKRVHLEEGVEILEGVSASKIEENGDELEVLTSDGRSFSADFVIIGIGVIPNTELASDAGLNVGNGIEVNAFCQTSNPDIYAIGDVTWHHNPIYNYSLRLESVPNATEQAKVAASHINGKPIPYNSLPWFWSDQYDLKLQIAGLSAGFDEIIIRGNIDEGRSFAAFYFDGDTFLAVDAVNAPREFMFSKQALSKRLKLDKSRLADETVDLKELILST